MYTVTTFAGQQKKDKISRTDLQSASQILMKLEFSRRI